MPELPGLQRRHRPAPHAGRPGRLRRWLALIAAQLVLAGSLATLLVVSSGDSTSATQDPVPGTTERLSLTSSQAEDTTNTYSSLPPETASNISVSDDGQSVVFASQKNLAIPGAPYTFHYRGYFIYLRDRRTQRTTLVSLGAWYDEGDNEHAASPDNGSFQAAISGNGRYVVFASTAENLNQATDDDFDPDIFVWDRGAPDPVTGEFADPGPTEPGGLGSEHITRMPRPNPNGVDGVSVGPGYDNATNDATDRDGDYSTTFDALDPSISDDGTQVTYTLHARDCVNDCADGSSLSVRDSVVVVNRDADFAGPGLPPTSNGVLDEWADADPSAVTVIDDTFPSPSGPDDPVAGQSCGARISGNGRYVALANTDPLPAASPPTDTTTTRLVVFDRDPNSDGVYDVSAGASLGEATTFDRFEWMGSESCGFDNSDEANYPPATDLEVPSYAVSTYPLYDRSEPRLYEEGIRPAISDNGRVVAYERIDDASTGLHLVYAIDRGPPASNGSFGAPFPRTLVSREPAPVAGDPDIVPTASAIKPAVSGDGEIVSFTSRAGLPGTVAPAMTHHCFVDSASVNVFPCAEVYLASVHHPEQSVGIVVTPAPGATESMGGEPAGPYSMGGGLSYTGSVASFVSRSTALVNAASVGGLDGDNLEDTFVRDMRTHLTIDPTAYDFGDVFRGDTSLPKTFTITNDGFFGTTLTSLTTGNPAMEVVPGPTDHCTGTDLPVYGTCTVDVRFHPTTAGTVGTTLDATTSDGATASSKLTGRAVRRPAALYITPDPAVFPGTVRGSSSAPVAVKAYSVGDLPVTITSVSLAGAVPGDYEITSTDCNGAVLPGSNGPLVESSACTVNVRFRPTAAGTRNALLSFADTSPGAPHTSGLTGQGIGIAQFKADPDPADFGTFLVGDERLLTVTVTDPGDAPLVIGSVSLAASPLPGVKPGELAAYNIVNTDCAGTAVAPLLTGSCRVDLRVTASAEGVLRARLVFNDSASGSPHSVPLFARAQQFSDKLPIFQATPNPLDFGPRLGGTTTEVRTVTGKNTGQAPLRIDDVRLEGFFPGDYSIVSDGCKGLILNPGLTCTVDLTFTGKAPGDRPARLVFQDTSPGTPHIVDLKANVAQPVLIVNPGLGPPGSVVTAAGVGWPADTDVSLVFDQFPGTWVAHTDSAGNFNFPDLLVFPRSPIGPRVVAGIASAGGVGWAATAPFLVVVPSVDGNPMFVFRT